MEPFYLDKMKDVTNIKLKQKFLNSLRKIAGSRRMVVVKIKKRILFLRIFLEKEVLEEELTIRSNLQDFKKYA